MAEKEKVNEELKANNQLEWVAKMNNIKNKCYNESTNYNLATAVTKL